MKKKIFRIIKIPLNKNYSYGFLTRYAEEPKDRTTPMKLYLIDMDETIKHESSQIQSFCQSFKGLSHLNLIDKGHQMVFEYQ